VESAKEKSAQDRRSGRRGRSAVLERFHFSAL
jgi:hypothetical protein